MARVEDGGGGGCFALNDDLLLHIFASYLDDTADLLRCAATCRRGRRLVASEAGFITCRRKPPSEDDRLVNALAVGSEARLQLEPASGIPPAPPLLPAPQPKATVLPSADMPEHYACARLATADLDGAAVHPLLRPGSAAFRIVVVYKRGKDTMCRSYSADAESWGAEGELSGPNISSRLLGYMGAGGVAVGGSVFWLSGDRVVFGLRLDTLQGRVESPKWYRMHRFSFAHPYPDRRLVVLPDGKLGLVQVGQGDAGNLVMNVFSGSDYEKTRHRSGYWRERRWDWENVGLDALLPSSVVSGAVKRMRLRSITEQDPALYALDLEKKKVQLMPVRPESCCFRRSSCSFQGCDNMDLVAYLTSLGA
uniref:F-box domain-containing protein n=1 Tax=Setaria italica TaxID=4555 RepID=K3YC93_SETIT